MSIRPIDMTASIQRSLDTIKTGANDVNHRPEVLYHQFAEQLQKQFKHNERQIQQSLKTQSTNIKQENKRHGKQKKNWSEKLNNKTDTFIYQDFGNSLLDIQV